MKEACYSACFTIFGAIELNIFWLLLYRWTHSFIILHNALAHSYDLFHKNVFKRNFLKFLRSISSMRVLKEEINICNQEIGLSSPSWTIFNNSNYRMIQYLMKLTSKKIILIKLIEIYLKLNCQEYQKISSKMRSWKILDLTKNHRKLNMNKLNQMVLK